MSEVEVKFIFAGVVSWNLHAMIRIYTKPKINMLIFRTLRTYLALLLAFQLPAQKPDTIRDQAKGYEPWTVSDLCCHHFHHGLLI